VQVERIHDGRSGLESEGGIDLGPVDSLMATGVPAGATLEEPGVVKATDENLAARRLLLEVTLKAERGVALGEEFGVDRSMGLMAGGAPFAQSFVLEHVRPLLGGVTFGAGLVGGKERSSTAMKGVTAVWIVAVRAGQLPLRHGVMMRQTERAAHIQMTGKADIGGLERIDDEGRVPAGLDVKIPRAMTGFTADIQRVGTARLQTGMTRGFEIPHEFVMTIRTRRCSHMRGARDGGGRHHGSGERAAGDEDGGQDQTCPGGEYELTDPSGQGKGIGFGAGPHGRIRLHKVANCRWVVA
jgi:hypothetical protein